MHIISQTHYIVEQLILESLFIEQILYAGDYPRLSKLTLFKLTEVLAIRIFEIQNILLNKQYSTNKTWQISECFFWHLYHYLYVDKINICHYFINLLINHLCIALTIYVYFKIIINCSKLQREIDLDAGYLSISLSSMNIKLYSAWFNKCVSNFKWPLIRPVYASRLWKSRNNFLIYQSLTWLLRFVRVSQFFTYSACCIHFSTRRFERWKFSELSYLIYRQLNI